MTSSIEGCFGELKDPDLIPGEYGLAGDEDAPGEPGVVDVDIRGCLKASSEEEGGRSGLESTALVAIEVRGAWRLWLRGICWPVR